MMDQIIMLPVNELKQHPKNEYYFDTITGEQQDEFEKSIADAGVRQPIIVNADTYTIVSGNRRHSACVKLGIPEIPCVLRKYESDDEELYDLIQTNIQQRYKPDGTAAKIGRMSLELTRLIKKFSEVKLSSAQAHAQTGNMLNISANQMKRFERIAKLPKELQDMVDGQISRTIAASKLITSLSEEEQLELVAMIPPAIRVPDSMIEEMVEKLRLKEEAKNDLQKQLEKKEEENAMLQEQLNQRMDDYVYELADKKEEALIKSRKVQEEVIKLREKMHEYEKMRKELNALKAREVSDVKNIRVEEKVVEVIPDDYETTKQTLRKVSVKSIIKACEAFIELTDDAGDYFDDVTIMEISEQRVAMQQLIQKINKTKE